MDDDFILQAWRDATNCYLAGMGLPPMKESVTGLDPDSRLYRSLVKRGEDIIDTEQDEYARKRGYRNIDELLDDPRRR